MTEKPERDINGERNEVAAAIKESYTFKTLTGTNAIYYYDEQAGYYKPEVKTGIIKSLVRVHLGKDATIRAEAEIKHYIQADTPTNPELFDREPHLIHFNNCWLDIETMQTYPHSEERLSMGKLAGDYDPKAKCPNILRLMGEVLKPVDVFHVMQIAGHMLYASNRFEKMHVWLGPGGNGKGKLAEVIEAAIGKDSITYYPTATLAKDKNAQAGLHRKMLNIDHDTSEGIKLNETSMLKKLISGNPVDVRHMYEPFFTLRNRAKFLVLTNSAPQFNTASNYADNRRLDLTVFSRTIGDDERDVHLIDKLTTKEEISGFLNLAVIGLRFLIKEGWARSMSIQAMQREFDKFGDTVGTFVREKCLMDEKSMTPTYALYTAYLEFCRSISKKPEAFNIFGGEIAKLGIDKRARHVSGVKVNVYVGIRLSIAPPAVAGKQPTL